MDFRGKEIVVAVTGGIACYKALEIIRRIKDAGGNVTVVMTDSAQEFVTPLSFQAISGRAVATTLFSLRQEEKINHINLAQDCDAILVAPATANIIAKYATGIADDLLSTILIAANAPVVIAPSMNSQMYEHPTVQENLKTLKKRGVGIIEPDSGFLACGYVGKGRLPKPEQIVNDFYNIAITEKAEENLPFKDVEVLITAGPTREKIDAVRYISNYSSGKMGYAVAKEAVRLGANVTLVSGPCNLDQPEGLNFISVVSAEEMYQEVMKYQESAQLIIKSAAVGDYRIEIPDEHKRKKQAGENLVLSLVENKDILKECGKRKTDKQFLVGFAAESQNLEEYAFKKLKEKNLDLIVANNIKQAGAGFDKDTNIVTLISKDKKSELPLMSKEEVAGELLKAILSDEKWQEVKSK